MQKREAEFAGPPDATTGFNIRFTANLKKFNDTKVILEIPRLLRVHLRQHDPSDRSRQNYPAFKMPDGSVPVLEASIALHSTEHPDWNSMTIGFPLAMARRSEDEHQIVLNFSGVRWTMEVDGEVMDNDFPFGYPQWAESNAWRLDAEYVRTAALYFPANAPKAKRAEAVLNSPIQYWQPPGHNSWVGDVVTIFHNGRYHVFYLYDRRHHQSKFGKGAHYFEHLSTRDFLTWTEHEAATPIEEQWECIGTGTPFVFKDKLYLTYGLHTGRIYPDSKTTWPAQWEYLNKHGRTTAFHRRATLGIPAGSTYSISANGVSNFVKSNITFHPCQNPSVYVDPEGRLRMLANAGSKGLWESESIDGGWRAINPEFPPGGDCTFFFRWGRFDYIIGGFTGLWSKPVGAPDSAYEDLVRKGLDFYDGSNVPSIAELTDGRFVMAAWVQIRGWGGSLIFRELVQFPDGRIGAKWMPEVTPATQSLVTHASRVADTATIAVTAESFMLSSTAQPVKAGMGRFAISFLPADGAQAACELQIRIDEHRAQFGPGSLTGFAAGETSLREGGAPHKAHNYAIENLIGIEDRFQVRVIVKGGDKIGGSLLDVEIAGQRTMISYRPELAVRRILVRTEDVILKNIQTAPLKS